MKIKKVNRYYCDFCKKSGSSKYYMEIHEKHCTLNPQRECRFCTTISGPTTSMEEMLKVMPNIEDYKVIKIYDDYESISYQGLDVVLKKSIDKIRELSNNCPGCILSVLRQSNLQTHAFDIFNYKEEVKMFWNERNKREYELEERGY